MCTHPETGGGTTMTVDPAESSATPKNRALDRLRNAVQEMEPAADTQADASTPRGNQPPDDREVRREEEKLDAVLGC